MIFTSLLALAAGLLTGHALAAPAAAAALSYTGDITHYSPSAGLGACGTAHADSEHVAALSYVMFDPQTPGGNPNNNPLCGRNIKINHKGKSVTVKVVDRCPSCAANDLDLSPSAFQVLESDLGVGRFQATWDWA